MDFFCSQSRQVFIFDSQEKTEHYWEQWKDRTPKKALLYPGLEASPYGGYIHSDLALLERFEVLNSFLQGEEEPFSIFTSLDAACLFVPTIDFFKHHQISLAVSDIISPQDLSRQLVDIGYRPTISTEEKGSFSLKGEIFDVFPLNGPPLRIHYFDDMIEEIFAIDLETQRTQRNKSYDYVTLGPCPHIFGSQRFSTTLRKHLPRFRPDQKAKNSFREEIFEALSDGNLFESYATYCPLFLDQKATLFDYLNSKTDMIHFLEKENAQQALFSHAEELGEDYERALACPP